MCDVVISRCMSKNLHPVQEKLLALLVEHNDDPLTVRQMQDALELTSTSVVAHHLGQLEKKGFLKRNPHNPRDYQVVTGEPEKKVAYINLYGAAACGPEGSILDDEPMDRVAIASQLISFPVSEAYMVKAKGKSMEPKLYEGDLVIARKAKVAEPGKVYVCVNNGEVLIKKLQASAGSFILNSFNPAFEPFIAAEDFRVEGEVRGVISRGGW